MSLRFPLAAAGLLLSCAATTLAEDWPAFRGPNRDGICKETGLLQAWPKDGPPKAWTVKNLGIGFGSPTVADGKIFGIGSRDKKDGVWALKESDGSELWFTSIADTGALVKNTNGPASSPTYDNGKVYTLSSAGTLACLDATSGKLAWKKNYAAEFDGKINGINWGFSESVLIDGDRLICTPGGPKAAVVALKADSGAVIWKTEVPGGVGSGNGYSSPQKATICGQPMYVVLLGKSGGVVGLAPATGKVLWQYNKAAMGGTAQIPIPIVKDDHVWVSTSYAGGSALIQIVAKGKDAFEVKELKTYTNTQLSNHHGGMVLVGEHLYFGHDRNLGYPVCVEFKTGEIKWGPITKATAGGQGSAAVLYADGRLYFRYQNGFLVLIEPSPDDLKVVSSFRLPEADVKSYPQSWPHPVIANGKLYIRDQNALHAYTVKADKN